MQRFRAVVVVSSALALMSIAPALAQESEAGEIVVTALHAIPGENNFPADVYLNGELAIEGFTKMMRTDPFVVEPGELLIEIFPAGADPGATEPALSQIVDLAEPGNFAMVAQLSDDGQPILSLYLNDVSPVAMGQGRFVFRQTSAQDSVDVHVNGEPIATELASTEEIVVTLPAGTFELEIVPTGGGDPLVATDVELVEGELTAVYAISTLTQGALDLAVQTVQGLQSAPSGIETGTGGLADDGSSPWRFALPVIVAALFGAGVMWVRRPTEG